MPLEAVVNLQVDEEELIRRLSGRRVCPNCGEPYHVDRRSRRCDGKCDKCGAELVHRADDQPEAIRNRLNVYNTQTAPVLDYYSGKGILKNINAVGGIQDDCGQDSRGAWIG